MIRCLLIIGLSLVQIFLFGQNKKFDSQYQSAVPYDTIYLKNNYRLIKSTTSDRRILRLLGPKIDTVILSKNIKASDFYLGKLQTDCEEYFILYFNDGETGMNIYEKQTGKLLVGGILIANDSLNNSLIFVDYMDPRNKLGLFDKKTMKIERFDPPHTACGLWWECIASWKLTEHELTIEYVVLNLKRETKTYSR